YALALPLTVLVLGAGFIAFVAVIGPLTGPMVWSGATSRQTLVQLLAVLRRQVLRAATLMAGLSLVGAAASGVVLVAGRVMAELSILVLGVNVPAEILMAGLLGHTVQAVDARVVSPNALPYITAANVGGGVVFALALVLPTLVYLRGVCEIYLLLRPKSRSGGR
ncbi:MAG TPA: hypothetical protein VFM33_01925, partial [Aquabacterium sp.]|nr:hypothetical protein [Aquabacterium sp.]